MESSIKVENLSFSFESQPEALKVFKKVSLQIKKGIFACIIGPSGCGKTTFLYNLSGLLRPQTGRIIIDGKESFGICQKISLVFQDPLLLPWKTVTQNIIYGGQIQKKDTGELKERAQRLIGVVGLRGFENYYPHQLSLGMKQRVNLARALITDPEILLLDEPFAHLDEDTRELMQQMLLSVHAKFRKTFIFVTHQIEEAVYLADEIVIFSGKNPSSVKKVLKVGLFGKRSPALKESVSFINIKNNVRKLR